MESPSRMRSRRLIPVVLVVAAVLQGCGGGGGGGGGGSGMLLAVSFVGYQPSPSAPFVPFVFLDQALEFTFDAPLDGGVLGGFLLENNVPVQFTGVAGSGPQGIPYLPFNDQAGARNAIQLRLNVAGGPLLGSYFVGRHLYKLDTIVVDPRVPPNNPFGLAPSLGFAANAQYVFVIPAGNALSFDGHPAQPIGPTAPLPIPIPPFSTQPTLSVVFQVGLAFGPNPTFPTVVAIDAMSAAPGTAASPIAEADAIIVTFSQLVTTASISPVQNFVIRNLDITNTSFPGGVPVPGSITPLTPGAIADVIFVFTPSAAYGPGPAPGEGFDIEVRVGTFGAAGIPAILGVPTGLAGTQLPLANSLNRTFRTTPCTGGCQTPASLVEGFDSSAQKDTQFVHTFGSQQARWNDASAPSQLAGRLTNGAPTGNTPQTLGTRIQFTVDPQPPTTNPAGLFAPFDAALANSGGACPGIPTGCNLGAGVNPNGGSHILHLYEAVELGSTKDSLEQIEWSPVNGVTAATTYPQYSIWCGVTSIGAPLAGGGGGGLTAVFDANYNLTPYQAASGLPIPAPCAANGAINPRKVACGGPIAYTVPLLTTQFVPFPTLSPCFDFARDSGASGVGTNLVFEQNIEPGQQAPNFNRYRANAFTPVRRLIGGPLSLASPGICPFNQGGTFDVYRARFTLVGIVGQARSLWYDTGAPDPTYLDFIVSPSVQVQPAGTQSTWILEGTDTSNPGPSTLGSSGVFIDAAGATHPQVLSTTLFQLRYFRFRVELRGNNVTNQAPAYSGVQMAYTLP